MDVGGAVDEPVLALAHHIGVSSSSGSSPTMASSRSWLVTSPR